MVAPIVEAAAVELGPLLARAGVALLGGAVVAGTGSLSGDTPNEHRKATPDVRAVSRTGGFQREACLLQETKGDYDQFLDEDGDPKFFFTGFTDTRRQILRQSVAVNSNPPAQLMWYFMTPRAREYLLPDLRRARVQSVYQP
ncbi:Tox-REase-5 domain-containing protein [Burkholderia multivorans]|uniref:Tox-REase-5 domain-containing protein n=1 Tax=Burkholderia multivorans TaxID=87883 RepID=UPI0020B1E89C|nr:Tox-REase-5 domain-containing protein [Burkholderia multivorans]